MWPGTASARPDGDLVDLAELKWVIRRRSPTRRRRSPTRPRQLQNNSTRSATKLACQAHVPGTGAAGRRVGHLDQRVLAPVHAGAILEKGNAGSVHHDEDVVGNVAAGNQRNAADLATPRARIRPHRRGELRPDAATGDDVGGVKSPAKAWNSAVDVGIRAAGRGNRRDAIGDRGRPGVGRAGIGRIDEADVLLPGDGGEQILAEEILGRRRGQHEQFARRHHGRLQLPDRQRRAVAYCSLDSGLRVFSFTQHAVAEPV